MQAIIAVLRFAPFFPWENVSAREYLVLTTLSFSFSWFFSFVVVDFAHLSLLVISFFFKDVIFKKFSFLVTRFFRLKFSLIKSIFFLFRNTANKRKETSISIVPLSQNNRGSK